MELCGDSYQGGWRQLPRRSVVDYYYCWRQVPRRRVAYWRESVLAYCWRQLETFPRRSIADCWRHFQGGVLMPTAGDIPKEE